MLEYWVWRNEIYLYLTEFLKKGDIKKTPSEIVGHLIYWFIMILVLIASLDALGLPIVSDLRNDVFLYIPNVIAAIIVLILGILFGNLLPAIVRTAASKTGLSAAEALQKHRFISLDHYVIGAVCRCFVG
jgi:hypothetical protein